MKKNTRLGAVVACLLLCPSVWAGAPAFETQKVVSSGVIEQISAARKQLVIDGKRYHMATRDIRLNVSDERIRFRSLYVGGLVQFIIAPQQGSSGLPAIQSITLVLQ
ncbi:MAG: hypothetical protein V7731_06380 [Amphritea sp.]